MCECELAGAVGEKEKVSVSLPLSLRLRQQSAVGKPPPCVHNIAPLTALLSFVLFSDYSEQVREQVARTFRDLRTVDCKVLLTFFVNVHSTQPHPNSLCQLHQPLAVLGRQTTGAQR